jgi:hypothetical protein
MTQHEHPTRQAVSDAVLHFRETALRAAAIDPNGFAA